MTPAQAYKAAIKLREAMEAKQYKLNKSEVSEFTKLHKEFIRKYYENIQNPYFEKFPGEVFYYGKYIATSDNDLVIDAHGPYVEIPPLNFTAKLKTKPGQEFRALPKYNNVKYEWLILDDLNLPELKVYKQKNTVNYADYKPGFLYIDWYEVNRFTYLSELK